MSLIDIKLPDIGGFKNVPVIEILVKPGDVVAKDTPLITLESDKATMEVPSPQAGTVRELRIKVGDTVNEDQLLMTLEAGDAAASPASAPQTAAPKPASQPAPQPASQPAPAAAPTATPTPAAPKSPAAASNTATVDQTAFVAAHASPSVRLFARELGADLSQIKGTGPNQRIQEEDVKAFIKQTMLSGGRNNSSASAAGGTSLGGLDLLPWPEIDFNKFGPTENVALSRIKKISGANLARNWVMIPHVTQFDEADITDLEALRIALNKENEKSGIKVTMLAFMMKACVAALKKFPDFNASLQGDTLVMKKYFHIGFAADTPNGLVVPVVRDCDQKGVAEIAQESAELAKKGRDGKLLPGEMQGGCFTISSLGGIGGTAFTPIINAPEVAILGVSKNMMKPVWDGKAFEPRLTVPLSLSYDHRVIDGAQAARFTAYLSRVLADMRRVLV